MKKNKRIIFATIAALSLVAPMTAVFNFDNVQTVSANHQGTKIWLQYGTLKYALKGPSGRVYPAGTRVVREMGAADTKPNISFPGRPFYLTWTIGGIPANQLLQDSGGGEIAEAYVNYEDWQEIDYPSQDNTVIVENTTDFTDLASSDFHPVDGNNPDVPVANTDKLDDAFARYTGEINFSKLSKTDNDWGTDMIKRYNAAHGMGATQASVDALTKEINDAVANYKKTGHLVSGNSDSGNNSNSGSSNSSNGNTPNSSGSSASSKSKSRVVRLRKASYRYTHKGKRVSKKLLKKGSYVKINGKTYRIKGKKYYRIAKNRYIRAVNVVKK